MYTCRHAECVDLVTIQRMSHVIRHLNRKTPMKLGGGPITKPDRDMNG